MFLIPSWDGSYFRFVVIKWDQNLVHCVCEGHVMWGCYGNDLFLLNRKVTTADKSYIFWQQIKSAPVMFHADLLNVKGEMLIPQNRPNLLYLILVLYLALLILRPFTVLLFYVDLEKKPVRMDIYSYSEHHC